MTRRSQRGRHPLADPAAASRRDTATAATAPPAPPWIGPVLLAVLVLAGAAAVFRTDDTDLWFHLAAGRSIAAHGLPDAERWTLAGAGQRPSLPGWAFHWTLWEVYRLGGFAGLALWRALLSMAGIGLAWAVARAAGARGAGALLLPLVIAVTRDRLHARTEQAFVVLLLFALWCFERSRHGRRGAWATLPAQLAWVNVHPSWIFAPALAWLYALEAWIFRPADSAARDRALRLAGIGAALAAMVLLTPPALDLRGVPFGFLAELGRRDPLVASIEELRPWSWTLDQASPFTALILLGAAAALLGGAAAWRASPPLVLVALAGLASGCAVYRMRAVAALLAAPALALALEGAAAGLRARVARGLAGATALAGIAWLALAPGFELGAEPQWRNFPVRATALADSLGLDGPVLNTFHYGGYLLWARGEGHPPLLDGRTSGRATIRDLYARAREDARGFDALLAAYPFTHAILEPPREARDRMAVLLAGRPGWSLVFADDAGLLYVNDQAYPDVSARLGYRLLTPDYEAMGRVATAASSDSSLATALEAELSRARESSPWHSRASLWLGLLALARGDAAGAVADFAEVERLAPLTPGLALRQGIALARAGDPEGARRAFRRALAEPADAVPAREALESLDRTAPGPGR